jgi:hypothetical protein
MLRTVRDRREQDGVTEKVQPFVPYQHIMKGMTAADTFSTRKKLSLFWALICLESLATGVYLILLPRDPKNSLIFGFSLQRLLMIAFILAAAVLAGTAIFPSLKHPGFVLHLKSLDRRDGFFIPAAILLPILFGGCFVLTQFPPALIDPRSLAYFERIHPLLVWGWIVGLEGFLAILYARFGLHPDRLAVVRPLLRPFVISFGTALLVWILIALTHSGQTPDAVSWRELGSPLLAWQFWLAVLTGMLLLLAGRWLGKKVSNRLPGWSIDAFLMAALYGLTLFLWQSQPLQNSYFSPEPLPPNYQVYPYSDALYYSLSAESVTTGNGLYGWTVTPRPYFLSILAYIFALAKGDIARVVTLQTYLLALIPLALYLLGKILSGRHLGLAVGLLAAFRELDAILSTHAIQLSHSRMIMSDLPTLLVMLAFLVLLVRWLQRSYGSRLGVVLVGGCLGLLLLFRTQAIVLLPFVLLLAWLQYPRPGRTWLRQCGWVLLALVLVISPWLARNYTLTGKVVFDDPTTQTGLLQSRYALDDSDTGGTSQDTGGSILQAVIHQPGAVIGFVLNHFLRNEIGTVFVTPPQPFIGTVDTLLTGTTFWQADTVALDTGQIVQVFLILAGMALGVAVMYRRWKFAGLAPLAVNVAYSLGNGLARNSGGRYNLPVDWVGYFYLAAGILQIFLWLLALIGRPEPVEEEPAPQKINPWGWRKTVMAGLVLVLVGSFIPLTERVFQQQYQTLNTTQLRDKLKTWNVDPTRATELAANSQTVILFARELYPRFYKLGLGEGGSNWAAYAPLDFCRMGFVTVGSDGIHQVIVTLARPPKNFPSRSDAIVLGQKASAEVNGKPVEYIRAELIVLKGPPPVIVNGLDSPPDTCRNQ